MSRRFLTPIGVLSRATNPSSGATGDMYYNSGNGKFYVHNGSDWTMVAGYTVSDTPPSGAAIGDRWVNSSTGIQYTYFNDGTSTQWVEIR